MKNVQRKFLMLVLVAVALSVVTVAIVGAQESEQLTVNVVDGATGAPVKNIIVSIESSAGVVEQRVITGSGGSADTILEPGSYRLTVEMSILGFPLKLSSTQIDVDEPTELTITVSTFLLPVQYIPTILYGGTGVLALSGIYSVVKYLAGRGAPKRPVDPDTQLECSIAMEGSVWKPPERPTDPETGETCSIVQEGSVWKPSGNPGSDD